MKKLIIVMLALGSVVTFTADASVVKCTSKINNKIESLKIKVNNKGVIVFWSNTKIVDASKKSFFSTLSDLENFGLEGSNNFFTPNGYSVLSVINTVEAIDIGVHKNFKKGFYSYRDGGSGLGNSRVALTCKPVNTN